MLYNANRSEKSPALTAQELVPLKMDVQARKAKAEPKKKITKNEFAALFAAYNKK